MITELLPEILAYIMVLTQKSALPPAVGATDEDGDPDPYLYHDHASQPFEIIISHVNLLLRDIALCTPELWSSIHIDASAQDARLILERTRTYIDRSGGYCLDLRIELNEARSDYEERWMLQQTLEAVAEESGRWRRLAIVSEGEGTIGIDSLISKLSQGEGGTAPSNLEYLSISTDHASNDGDEIEGAGSHSLLGSQHDENDLYSPPMFRKIALKCLPKLYFLRLRGLALYTFQLIFLPALQVLHLDQTKSIPMTSKLFEHLAVACPVLEHLSVYGDIIKSPAPEGGDGGNVGRGIPLPGRVDDHTFRGGSGGNNGSSRGWTAGLSTKSSQGVISLPQLQSLRVCGTQGSVYKILLSQLESPKLRNLMLKDVHEHDLDILWEAPLAYPQGQTNDRLSRAYTSTLVSRFIQIQSFIISNSNLSKSIYQELFRVFPSITEFASYSSMDPDTASNFLDGRVKDIPWPKLRMLTFIFDVDLTADDEAIAKMLQKRKGVGYPVQQVRIGVEELGVDYVQVEGLVAQETVIAVERLENFDVWPSDRVYLDIDDVLF